MGKRTLKADQEAEIYRRTLAEPAPTHLELAAEYGVNESTISRAVARARKAAQAPDGESRPVALDIPWDRVHRWDGQPRKHFDPEALESLAGSVVEAGGVKQSILVRPHPELDGQFWLIAGERRWRAVGLLVERGQVPAGFAIPARVEWECDDLRALELAMIENLQRHDMNAMEEAEGYARMLAEGRSCADIARRVLGKPEKERHVQLRFALVAGLCDQAKEALRQGEISVEQARALRVAPPAKQAVHLPAVVAGSWGYRTTEEIRRTLKGGMVAVKHFPQLRDLYHGEIAVDEETGEELYADAAALQLLRAEELERKRAELAAKFPWVEVKGGEYGHYSDFDYQPDRSHPLAGAVIQIDSFGKLQIHRHLVRRADLRKIDAGAHVVVKGGKAKVEADSVTKAHFAHAKRRKSAAMRDAVANDALAARKLVCLALLGGHTAVDIRAGERRHFVADAGDPLWLTERVQALGRGWGMGGGGGFGIDAVGRVTAGSQTTAGQTEAELWRKLDALSEDALDRLFAALVALRVGSFNGGVDPCLGDEPATLAIAASLGLVGHEQEAGLGLHETDLEGLRKPALLAAVQLSGTSRDITHGVASPAAYSAKDLAEELRRLAPDLSGRFVLPTLRFAGAGAIKAVLARAVEPAQIDIAAVLAATPRLQAPATADVTFADLAGLLAAYAAFPFDAATPFGEIVGVEDFPRLAAELAETYGITLDTDDLFAVEDPATLAALIERRRAHPSSHPHPEACP